MDAGAASPPDKTSPRATHVAHAWLTADVYGMLELEATRRRLHPDQLAARILTILLSAYEVGSIVDI